MLGITPAYFNDLIPSSTAFQCWNQNWENSRSISWLLIPQLLVSPRHRIVTCSNAICCQRTVNNSHGKALSHINVISLLESKLTSLQLDPQEQISWKLESKHNFFLKCIWKCVLQHVNALHMPSIPGCHACMYINNSIPAWLQPTTQPAITYSKETSSNAACHESAWHFI